MTEDFATEWDKDLTTDERVALLAKTFDNKVESDDEEEEEEETWRCEECGRDDMKEEDIGGHFIDGGCVCNDCAKEEYQFCYKNAHKIEHLKLPSPKVIKLENKPVIKRIDKMNCGNCACTLSEEKMSFEVEWNDGGILKMLCGDCFEGKDEDDVLVAVWKFGTSVGVDEDELEDFDVNDYKDYMFSSDGGEEEESDPEEEKEEPQCYGCETCESKCDRLIEYCGLKGEQWNVCEDCEIKFDEERIKMIDDPEFPNIYPYKLCSVCDERSSCGSYNDDMYWLCESCTPVCYGCGDTPCVEPEDPEDLRFCESCKPKPEADSEEEEEKADITIDTIAKHIAYNPEDDFVCEDGMSCAQFIWDYENEKIDEIANEEFRNALGDKKKSLMWVEKFKEVANWKKGEYIYAFTKTNADGFYNVHYKKDKLGFTWFNTIVEPNGYVAMKTYNHYSFEEDDDIKHSIFLRVESIYNDKYTK